MTALLAGKKALILGVANDYSIAWGITKKLKEQGAAVALTYMNAAIEKRVRPLAEEVQADFVAEMDVAQDAHYPALAETVAKNWQKFDILVHSLAFAPREDLQGPFVATTREGFKTACDISAFSLIGLCNALLPLFNPGSSVMAMTYRGSQHVIPGYKIMGVAKAALEAAVRYLADDLGPKDIRVNAISSGPIKTLAASGVGVRSMGKTIEEQAPLRRKVCQTDIGGAAVYLASDLSTNVTGQILYVDAGASIIAPF